MEQEVKNEALLRKYLLGELNEADEQALEEELLADDELSELLLAEEDELVDDYLGGELSEGEHERFDSHFMVTPERERKLSFGKALKSYKPRVVPTPVSEDSGQDSVEEEQGANGRTKAPGVKDSGAKGFASSLPLTVVEPPASFVVDGPSSWWNRASSSPYLKMAAAAVIVLAVGLGAWRAYLYVRRPQVSKGIASLREAYRDQRPTEARITELDYAPAPPTTRGPERDKFDYVALDRAKALIQLEANEHPSAQAYHDLGRLYLAQRDFDKAIDQFERALRLREEDPQVHCDLGATYLERAASRRERPSIADLAESLKQLNRAIELDGSLLAARFNRALCLQRMDAATAAKEAWEDYLKRDPNSDWSSEAQRNLQLLRSQSLSTKTPGEVLEDFLQAYRKKDVSGAWRIQSQTKEMITGMMIPFQLARAFIASNSADQTEAGNEILGAFRFVGELETQRTGDPFFAELAGFYTAAGRKNADTLKRAHDALDQGYKLCLEGRYNSAEPHFGNAKHFFEQAGDTWESKVVDYWRGYCLSYRADLKTSSALFWTLAEDCQRRDYRWLESQSYCWLGNNSALQGKYSDGIEQDKTALRVAGEAADSYAVQKASSQIADRYKFLGRLKEALEFNQMSLPSADSYFVSRRQLWRSLDSITDTLFALRLYAAAEAYQQEALQLALNSFDDSALTHSTYRRLGQIYAGQEKFAAAEEALDLSLKALEPINDDPICKRLRGLSLLQVATVKRQKKDYPSALEYYEQAAKEFDSSGIDLHSYNTHKGMLLCYLLNKDDAAIQREMPTVLSFFERNRKRIKEEQNRNAFFDSEQDIYDLAIEYEHDRNNYEESFYYAQLSKARSLQDAITRASIDGDDEFKPFTVRQLKERLPANLQLVEYAVLRDRLLIWFLTKTDFRVMEQRVPIGKLEALTKEYLELLTRNDSNSIEREKLLAAELYDLVFAPVEGRLDSDSEVALVPDKFLFNVPFAALLSRRSGQRLVSDFRLLYAPSPTVLVLCSDLAGMKAQDKRDERLLSVGDPLLDYARRPDLRSLPSAAAEAEGIAPFYRTSAVFLGRDALKRKIESKLWESDVLHFAAHYVVDKFEPNASRLLLTAKTNETSDDLTLQEIQEMRLPRAKVAVLSACRSGIERYYAGEGLIGLSRAFLMARIPLVIASQWAVASDSTADLMIEFHKLRKVKNQPTTEALRQAQLAMLSHEDERYHRPYYWAAFFAIGGHASY